MPFDLDLEEALGLRLCSWPGRAQTLRLSDDAVLLLDGAHTRESMLECVNWYRAASKEFQGRAELNLNYESKIQINCQFSMTHEIESLKRAF